MAENTNLSLTLEAWAQIVIEKWKLKIAALDIGRTGDLVRSFYYEVYNGANGNPEKIMMMFNMYGKYVDMGVGKEFAKGDWQRNDGRSLYTTRKPKEWYSKVFFAQIARLRDILAEKYSKAATDAIVNIIETSFDQRYSDTMSAPAVANQRTVEYREQQQKRNARNYARRRGYYE